MVIKYPMPKEARFMPSAFAAQQELFQKELALAAIGVSLKKDRAQKTPSKLAYKDVLEFTHRHTSEQLSIKLKTHLKESVSMPAGEFGLLPVHNGPNQEEADGYAWIDGNYGFLLTHKEPGQDYQLKLASTSFTTPNNPVHVWPNVDKSKFVPNSIIICQLQAYRYFKTEAGLKKGVANREILNKFRWEHLLVDMTIDLAHETNLNAVYIEPSARNSYAVAEINKNVINRYKMRYDVTAQRMNFVEDSQGFYGLLLT